MQRKGKKVDRIIEGYEIDKHPNDFFETKQIDGHDIAGVGEICGRRSGMQDAMSVDLVSGMECLTYAQQKSLFKMTFAQMQEKHGDRAGCGSTVCGASVWVDEQNVLHGLCAYVGDSTAFVVVINEDKPRAAIVNLNQNIHIPDPDKNKKEYDRVVLKAKNNKGSSPSLHTVWRVAGELSVSRAIGDKKYERHGLSHKPSVGKITVSLKGKEKIFLVVACDGLTEWNALTPNEIKKIVYLYRNEPLHEIAFQLIKAAFEGGPDKNKHQSTDNMTCIVVLIVPGQKPVFVAVYDAHGVFGEEVSTGLANDFHPCLMKNMNYMMNYQKVVSDNTNMPDDALIAEYTDPLLLSFFKKRKEIVGEEKNHGDKSRLLDYADHYLQNGNYEGMEKEAFALKQIISQKNNNKLFENKGDSILLYIANTYPDYVEKIGKDLQENFNNNKEKNKFIFSMQLLCKMGKIHEAITLLNRCLFLRDKPFNVTTLKESEIGGFWDTLQDNKVSVVNEL